MSPEILKTGREGTLTVADVDEEHLTHGLASVLEVADEQGCVVSLARIDSQGFVRELNGEGRLFPITYDVVGSKGGGAP